MQTSRASRHLPEKIKNAHAKLYRFCRTSSKAFFSAFYFKSGSPDKLLSKNFYTPSCFCMRNSLLSKFFLSKTAYHSATSSGFLPAPSPPAAANLLSRLYSRIWRCNIFVGTWLYNLVNNVRFAHHRPTPVIRSLLQSESSSSSCRNRSMRVLWSAE